MSFIEAMNEVIQNGEYVQGDDFKKTVFIGAYDNTVYVYSYHNEPDTAVHKQITKDYPFMVTAGTMSQKYRVLPALLAPEDFE